MDRSFLRLVFIFFVLVLLTFAGVAVWQLKVVGYGGFEFRFHRSQYQGIAEQARQHAPLEGDLKTAIVKVKGKEVDFAWFNRSVMQQPSRDEGPTIWLSRQKGNIVLWLETKDWGHAGQFGYAFSANGDAPEWLADNWGEYWSLGRRLDDHWWQIENRLN